MTEFIYAVYRCELGWMDKGGRDGEYWPEGRYYISRRSEATLAWTAHEARKIVEDSVKRETDSVLPDKPKVQADFNLKYEFLIGTKVGMVFYYATKHKLPVTEEEERPTEVEAEPDHLHATLLHAGICSTQVVVESSC